MATSSESPKPSLLTRATVRAMQQLYPEDMADHSFDNTGLLLEAPAHSAHDAVPPSILLCIDISRAVVDEAMEKNVGCIIGYHPLIFRGLKQLQLGNSQQQSLLRLAAAGISVYCPHTAVDAAEAGNASWLADVITSSSSMKPPPPSTTSKAFSTQSLRTSLNFGFETDTTKSAQYQLYRFPSNSSNALSGLSRRKLPSHTREPIKPGTRPKTGHGRLIKFSTPASLSDILFNIADGLGGPKSFSLGVPSGTTALESIRIRRIALCAGSGYDVVTQAVAEEGEQQAYDMIVTGEMRHHEALAEVEAGRVVVCVGHSNSERGYLAGLMRPLIQEAVKKELSALGDERGLQVLISERDTDPLQTLVLEHGDA